MGGKASLPQNFDQNIHSAAVFRGSVPGDLGIFEGCCAGILDGKELTRVGVVLHISVRFDEEGVSDDKSAPPTGHIEGLADAVEFQSHVLGSWDGKEAQRLSLKNQRGVGGIMDNDDLLLFRELDHLLEKLRSSRGSRRIVRIVENQHLRFVQNLPGDGIEAWQEFVLGREGRE